MTKQQTMEQVPHGFELLSDDEDFLWYKNRLDVDRRYQHRHVNSPNKYPCVVRSSWEDDPQGPYQYIHEFMYLKSTQNVTCQACGAKETAWRWDFDTQEK